MARVWVGIDPGKKGALSYIVEDQPPIVRSFPKLPNGAGDFQGMVRMVRDLLEDLVDWGGMVTVAVEAIHSFPHQSCVATFTQGTYYGGILGVVATCHVSYTLVQPKTWKAKVLLPEERKLGKPGSIQAVRRLIPGWEGAELTDGEADAACIAWYARHFIG